MPLVLAAAVLCSGCAPKQEAVPIKVAVIEDIISLDPANTKDIISETVARCIFSTLYTFDEQMNLTPCLAESSEHISDTEWLFHLRKDAKFHDGSKLTAADVKFSIERAQTAEKADNSLQAIASIEVVDESTVKVTTQEILPSLPSLFVRASTSIMSQAAVSRADYNFDQPIGSGPFVLETRVPGQSISLRRFPDYFLGAAQTELLEFLVEPSEQTGTASILNSTVDILFRVSASDGDYLDLNEDVNLYQMDSTKTELLLFNPQAAPLDDIRVRKAIACAIDKQNIVDNVLDGYGTPQSSMLPAPLPGFLACDDYSYDPEQARALLEEAGYADGFSLTALTFDIQRKKLMEYLKLDLAQVNIQLDYEFLELKDYLALVEQDKHMLSVMSWTSNPDPDSTFVQLYSKAGHPTLNQSGFIDPQVDDLLMQARTLDDAEQRRTIYEQINKLIAASYHSLPLYQPAVLVAARSDIEGVRINPQGLFGYETLSRKAA